MPPRPAPSPYGYYEYNINYPPARSPTEIAYQKELPKKSEEFYKFVTYGLVVATYNAATSIYDELEFDSKKHDDICDIESKSSDGIKFVRCIFGSACTILSLLIPDLYKFHALIGMSCANLMFMNRQKKIYEKRRENIKIKNEKSNNCIIMTKSELENLNKRILCEMRDKRTLDNLFVNENNLEKDVQIISDNKIQIDMSKEDLNMFIKETSLKSVDEYNNSEITCEFEHFIGNDNMNPKQNGGIQDGNN